MPASELSEKPETRLQYYDLVNDYTRQPGLKLDWKQTLLVHMALFVVWVSMAQSNAANVFAILSFVLQITTFSKLCLGFLSCILPVLFIPIVSPLTICYCMVGAIAVTILCCGVCRLFYDENTVAYQSYSAVCNLKLQKQVAPAVVAVLFLLMLIVSPLTVCYYVAIATAIPMAILCCGVCCLFYDAKTVAWQSYSAICSLYFQTRVEPAVMAAMAKRQNKDQLFALLYEVCTNQTFEPYKVNNPKKAKQTKVQALLRWIQEKSSGILSMWHLKHCLAWFLVLSAVHGAINYNVLPFGLSLKNNDGTQFAVLWLAGVLFCGRILMMTHETYYSTESTKTYDEVLQCIMTLIAQFGLVAIMMSLMLDSWLAVIVVALFVLVVTKMVHVAGVHPEPGISTQAEVCCVTCICVFVDYVLYASLRGAMNESEPWFITRGHEIKLISFVLGRFVKVLCMQKPDQGNKPSSTAMRFVDRWTTWLNFYWIWMIIGYGIMLGLIIFLAPKDTLQVYGTDIAVVRETTLSPLGQTIISSYNSSVGHVTKIIRQNDLEDEVSQRSIAWDMAMLCTYGLKNVMITPIVIPTQEWTGFEYVCALVFVVIVINSCSRLTTTDPLSKVTLPVIPSWLKRRCVRLFLQLWEQVAFSY